MTGIVAVAPGWGHTLFLKSDGTVWSVGYNPQGQLGDGTTVDKTTPVQVLGLTNVKKIACGWFHSLAIDGAGKIWAWGYDGYGGLGDGSATNRTTPFPMNPTGAVSIAAGYAHSVVVLSNGTVWTCGYNDSGQLGFASSAYSATQVPGVTNAVAAAAGFSFSAILKSDGTVWTTGNNSVGQLGDGTTTNRSSFQQVPGLTGVKAIAAGQSHMLALKNDGTMVAWGDNSGGALGDGTLTNRLSPVPVQGLNDAVFMAVFSYTTGPTFQWQRKPAGQTSFVNLTESTTYKGVGTSILRVVGATPAMTGDQFRCICTAAGTTTSNAATLTVGGATVTIVSGNNQYAAPGAFNTFSLDAAAWNGAGTLPLMGTAITFTVQSGGGQLATTNTGSPTLSSTITLNTDIDGSAQVFYKQPTATGVTSQIVASSNGGQITFTTTNVPGTPPSVPGWVHTASSTPTAISFNWANSIPAGGATIAGYNIYRNGTLLNTSLQLSTAYSDSGLSAGTVYTYTIKAVDSAGNVSNAATLNISTPTLSTSGTFDVLSPTP